VAGTLNNLGTLGFAQEKAEPAERYLSQAEEVLIQWWLSEPGVHKDLMAKILGLRA
jgi:hypothetical protein